jgi:hypothetical protein
MTRSIAIKAEDEEGVAVLFETLVDNVEQLRTAGASFEGKSAGSATLGSGLPEITQIILAFGSAGAYTAIATVLKQYFDKRPKGNIIFVSKSKDKQIVLSASDVNQDLAKALPALFERIEE